MIGLDQVVSTIVDISLKIKEQAEKVESNKKKTKTLSDRIQNIAKIVEGLKTLKLEPKHQQKLIKPLDDLVGVLLKSMELIADVKRVGALKKFIKAGSFDERFTNITELLAQRITDVQLAIEENNARQLQALVAQIIPHPEVDIRPNSNIDGRDKQEDDNDAEKFNEEVNKQIKDNLEKMSQMLSNVPEMYRELIRKQEEERVQREEAQKNEKIEEIHQRTINEIENLRSVWVKGLESFKSEIIAEIQKLGTMQVDHHQQNQQQFNNLNAQINRGYNQAEQYHEQTTSGLNKLNSQVGNLNNATVQNGQQLQGIAQQLGSNQNQMSAMSDQQRQHMDLSNDILSAVKGNEAQLQNLLREKEETDQYIEQAIKGINTNGQKLDAMAIEQAELGVDLASARNAIDSGVVENRGLHQKLASDLQNYREVTMQDAQQNRQAQQKLVGMQQQVLDNNLMIIDQGAQQLTHLQALQQQQMYMQQFFDQRMNSVKRQFNEIKSVIPGSPNSSQVFTPASLNSEGKVFFDEGQKYEGKNKLDKAKEHYKKAVKKDYEPAAAAYARVALLVESQKPKESQEAMQQRMGANTAECKLAIEARKNEGQKNQNELRQVYQKAPENNLNCFELFSKAMVNMYDTVVSATSGRAIYVVTDNQEKLQTAKQCFEKLLPLALQLPPQNLPKNKSGRNIIEESQEKLQVLEAKLAAQSSIRNTK